MENEPPLAYLLDDDDTDVETKNALRDVLRRHQRRSRSKLAVTLASGLCAGAVVVSLLPGNNSITTATDQETPTTAGAIATSNEDSVPTDEPSIRIGMFENEGVSVALYRRSENSSCVSIQLSGFEFADKFSASAATAPSLGVSVVFATVAGVRESAPTAVVVARVGGDIAKGKVTTPAGKTAESTVKDGWLALTVQDNPPVANLAMLTLTTTTGEVIPGVEVKGATSPPCIPS